jgi:hypothetical protein
LQAAHVASHHTTTIFLTFFWLRKMIKFFFCFVVAVRKVIPAQNTQIIGLGALYSRRALGDGPAGRRRHCALRRKQLNFL